LCRGDVQLLLQPSSPIPKDEGEAGLEILAWSAHPRSKITSPARAVLSGVINGVSIIM